MSTANSTFLAGSAKVDITPPLTIPYLGYEPRHALFTGVHDRLLARAIGMEHATTAAIVISADALGFSNAILGPQRNFTAEVRQRVSALTGVPAAHILLTATHAHSTPETVHLRRLLDTPATAPWLEVLIDQLVSAASMAWSARRPSHIKVGKGEVHGMLRNRRVIGRDGRIVGGPERAPDAPDATPGPVDPTVGVALVEANDGSERIVLVNFACHPVTVQVQPLVSADFPGVAMTLVEKNLPTCVNSLFLQGACGNINPLRTDQGFADVERWGLMLGGEVLKVAAQISAPEHPALQPLIGVDSRTIELTVRDLPERAPLQQQADELAHRLTSALSSEERSALLRQQRLVEETLVLIDRGSAPIPAEVQVIRIGDLALVALPGELFCELGMAITQRSPAPHTFVIGYSNDWIGYLTTPNAWQEGGYEVARGPWTRVGPLGGEEVVAKSLVMLEELWNKSESAY